MKVPMTINVPVELKAAIDEAADAAQEKITPFVTKLIADALGVDLPPSAFQRKRKYATVEERIAAQKKRMEERNQLIKRLLAEHKAKTGED